MDPIHIDSCPLCGLPSHQGKCPKTPKGEWWCGICLLGVVAPTTEFSKPLSPAVLFAAGVQRTTKWCVRCGSTLCARHGFFDTARPRCLNNCLTRTPAETARLKSTLEIYTPDFLAAGPIRCVVCKMPAYRRELCHRHYRDLRNGKKLLSVERQRTFRGNADHIVSTYISADLKACVESLAMTENKSMSAWIAALIEREVLRQCGVNTDPNPSVI